MKKKVKWLVKERGYFVRENIIMNDLAKDYSEAISEVLKSIYDPDIELDIYNLGLVYEVNMNPDHICQIVMTFTSPGCECVEIVPVELREKIRQIDGITDLDLNIVWDPAWNMNRISRIGRITLGISPR